MSDLKDIWNSDAGELSEEELLAYLEGRLPDAERHAIEARLSEDGPESDALEGLQGLSPGEAKSLRNTLHRELQQQLRKKRRPRRGLSTQRWSLIAVVIILLLATVCYAIIYLMSHRGR